MGSEPLWRCCAVWVVLVPLWLTGVALADEEEQPANPWAACCAVEPWPAMRQWPAARIEPDPAALARYRPRQATFRTAGVPIPYADMTNPLPRTLATVEHGRRLYGERCAVCHGVAGNGEGVGSHDMMPPPGRLTWLAQVAAAFRDSFLYWTISEGGAPFGTGMTAFAGLLTADEIWAIAAYVQARLPEAHHPQVSPPA